MYFCIANPNIHHACMDFKYKLQMKHFFLHNIQNRCIIIQIKKTVLLPGKKGRQKNPGMLYLMPKMLYYKRIPVIK